MTRVMKEEIEHRGVSVVIASRACIQEVKRRVKEKKKKKGTE
jgi:TPP-dependent indolepyruvate ferredoxin oxidoreductase alpha subunit